MIRKLVPDGEQFPTLYRFAWYDYCRRRSVCYPIGINWLAWAIRAAWNWSYKRGWPDAWERACCEMNAKLREEYAEKRARDQRECEQWRDMAMKASFEAGTYLAKLESMHQVEVGDMLYVGSQKGVVVPAGETGEVIKLGIPAELVSGQPSYSSAKADAEMFEDQICRQRINESQ